MIHLATDSEAGLAQPESKPAPVPTGLPSRAERFAEAASAYGQALAKQDNVDLAFARRKLAEVAWNLAPQIEAGLKAVE